MDSNEWLQIVDWVESRYERGWSLDVAVKYGAALRQADASAVCEAIKLCPTLPTLGQIKGLMRRSSDRFRPAIEQAHRRQFPNGCPTEDCEVCLDTVSPSV